MKQYVGFFAGLMLLASCSSDNKIFEQQGNPEGVKSFTSFTATIDEMADTKAYLEEVSTSQGKHVFWNQGDEIAVFSDSQTDLTTFKMSSISNGAGYFSGNQVSGNTFHAFFPYDEFYRDLFYLDSTNPNLLHTALLADGPTTDNGFKFVAPMIATSGSNSFCFKQTTGMIHVTIGGIYQIDVVMLRGLNQEKLMGAGVIDLSGDNPVLTIIEDEDYTYTTYAGGFSNGGITNGNPIDIYFIIPPMTFENGFTLEISGSDKDGTSVGYQKTYSDKLTVGRAEVKHFSLVDVEAELEALQGRHINLGPDAAVIHGKGGSTSVTINSMNDWKATVDKGNDWLTLSSTSGKNGDLLTITTNENLGGYSRSAVILIDDGKESQKIEFVQCANIITRKAVVNHRKARFSSIFEYDNNVEFYKVMVVMPYQVSNNYQEIHEMKTNLEAMTSLDGQTQYGLATFMSGFPASGEEFAYTEVEATLYEVHVNFDAIWKELPYDKNSTLFKLYTGDSANDQGDKIIDTSDARIQNIGDNLWEQSNGSIVEYARLCYEYVANNFEYKNANTGLHAISNLLDNGGGDCGNLSAIYVSLLRYKEIPSRIIAMLLLSAQAMGVEA